MPLTDEERKAIVVYRLEKADGAYVEAKDCASMGHWTLAANRLYYATVSVDIVTLYATE